jgi:hypothetical protein
LGQYVESVRDIERRIQRAEEQNDREMPVVQHPAGAPARFDEYAAIMYDLLALAYQTDLTRVGTLLYGREQSGRTYPEIGVPDPHHPISHHGNRPDYLEKLAKVNAFHVQLFARFVEKLRTTPDGDGSLLDHSVLLYGAGMSNSDLHVHHDLPLVLVGGPTLVRGGRYTRYPMDTPVANLHLALLQKLGIPSERLGDSNAVLEGV